MESKNLAAKKDQANIEEVGHQVASVDRKVDASIPFSCRAQPFMSLSYKNYLVLTPSQTENVSASNETIL